MDHAVMDHFSAEAMKLGAQGVSILAATGDDGVAGYKARNDTKMCKYTASFPATCPWVTSVGATQNAENDPEDHEVHTLQEYAANAPEQQGPFFAVTTAGGFSNYFDVPFYQADVVESYFATPAGKRAPVGYNTTGRGFPDISSNGMNYQTFINSSPALVCGTSGAAPSVGGMVSTANAARVKAGKSRLGFLNPLFYSKPSILNDITHGWNNCTALRTVCCPMGFTSTSGWDPLVGLGSPSYIRLLKESGLSGN
jgi:tripeptidyl-peptidase-1